MEKELEKALQYYKKGEFNKTIAIYQTLIKENPHAALAYQGLAQCFMKLNKIDEAYDACIKALELNQELTISMLILGNIYINQNKLDFAEEILQKAITVEPNQVDVSIALSMVYSRSGRIQKSVFILQNANRLDPGNWKVNFNLAVNYRSQNLHREALKEFWIAFKLSPSLKTGDALMAEFISINKWLYAIVVIIYFVALIIHSIFALPLIVLSAGYFFTLSYIWYKAKGNKQSLVDFLVGLFLIASYFLLIVLTHGI